MPQEYADPAPAPARLRLARVLLTPTRTDRSGAGDAPSTVAPSTVAPSTVAPAGVEPARLHDPGDVRGGRLARLGGAGAFDPGRAGVRALAAVAAVVVLAAAVLAWWSRPRPEPVVPQLGSTAEAAPGPTGPTGPAELVVTVSGKVHRPGLVRLPPGARVADAVDAAGGLLPDTDLDYLNLARKVTDGELVAVGIPPPPGGPGAAADAGTAATGAKINLNTASTTELETLPGVGPVLAQRIVDRRSEHGRFSSVGALRQVSGIGDARFADLEDLVTVG